MVVLANASAWAFSQQTLMPNGNYDFNYGALDDKYKTDKSTNKSDPNSSGLHFSVEHGQAGSFGSRGFGSDRDPGPPDYFRALSHGD
jgi:hypothetical protein